MASLRKTSNGSYIVCFRWQGKQHHRGLHTRVRAEAQHHLVKIQGRLGDLARGASQIPPGIDPVEFVFKGEAAVKQIEAEQQQAREAAQPPFRQLVDEYLRSCRRLKATSSLSTERCHLKNWDGLLGTKAELPLSHISLGDLEVVQQQRLDVAQATTVMKERQTLISFFAWAQRTGYIASSIASQLPSTKSAGDPPSFCTFDEVEVMLARGGLTPAEENDAWERLYLTQTEIGEILALVRQQARQDFVHPMIALAAFTGMRRGEIQRLRWMDVNCEHCVVTAVSRKQSSTQNETTRAIDMHPELVTILQEYRLHRPKGQYVICDPETLEPLTANDAHRSFQHALRGTRWEQRYSDKKKRVVIGFHTFRHSFASNLARLGNDQRLIDRWMGHQTEAMRKRYQHLFPSARRVAIESLAYTHPANNADKPQPTSPEPRPPQATAKLAG